MEGEANSHQLKREEKKAEKVFATLPEEIKTPMRTVLDIQKLRNSLYFEFEKELQALHNKYDIQYAPIFLERSSHIKSIENFWLKVLQNSDEASSFIHEQDIPLLQHLIDIQYHQSPNQDSFKVDFEFSANDYIENTVLSKEFIIKNDVLEKSLGTEILWKGKNNLTKKTKQVKKGKKGKAMNKTVDIPSFFRIFENRSPEDEEDIPSDEEDIDADPFEDEMNLGYELRDEIIPNALYYYMGIREKDEDEESDGGEKEQKKATEAKVDGSGQEKQECKQQ